MAICGGCGNQEARRTRSDFDKHGSLLKEICTECAPEQFDRWQDPTNKKMAMGWEAYPEKYIRKENPNGGWMYVARDEYRADQEAKFIRGSIEEEQKQLAAIEKKRRERRTAPLRNDEKTAILNKYEPIIREKVEAEKKAQEKAKYDWLQ